MKRGSGFRFTAFMLFLLVPAVVCAQEDMQSTTGPVPPPGVVSPPVSDAKAIVSIPGVPAYLWRHGCGPTAVGMVAGYWDGLGLDLLVPGSAATQTNEVNQAIASGGSSSSPYPAGSERHYEDYAAPEDNSPNMLQDGYIQQSRTPHVHDCLADFMKTSFSSRGNYYGWSWSSDVIPSFTNYVTLKSAAYIPYATGYWMSSTLTFDVLKAEIDQQRPMVFLVDSSGDGTTDHFVTVVGYNEGPPQTYVYYNTWDHGLHESEFRAMSASYPWGVWGGWAFNIEKTVVFTSGPAGGIYHEGESLSWTVQTEGAVGDVSYQWVKDDVELSGRIQNTFVIDSLTLADQGWYFCRVTDEGKGVYESDHVFVKVEPLEGIPAAGMAGVGALALLFAVAGVARARGARG